MTDLTVNTTNRRLDLQALRALAVVAVMLNHSWPGLAPGGFFGVDIFFVVSGYLITRHLVGEYTRDGRIRLGRFYARRARRLLPAATLVLVTVAIATLLVVPVAQWGPFFTQIAASALYSENWVLLASHVGPDPDTAVRHFWSLSVEEQFYLVWPLLVIAGGALAVRSRREVRLTLFVGAAAIVVVSLVAWIVVSAFSYQAAYFNTGTRAWEFAAGGALALLPGLRARGRWADALFWAGLSVVVASIALIPDNPGALSVLPVAGTIAIMVACAEALPASARRIVGWRSVQVTGDISYALYLWHWPVLLFAPYVTGAPSPTWLMVLLLAFTVALSWATTHFVEDPVRRTPLEGERWRPRRRIAAVTVVGGIIVTLVLSGIAATADPRMPTGECGRGGGAPACVARGVRGADAPPTMERTVSTRTLTAAAWSQWYT